MSNGRIIRLNPEEENLFYYDINFWPSVHDVVGPEGSVLRMHVAVLELDGNISMLVRKAGWTFGQVLFEMHASYWRTII